MWKIDNFGNAFNTENGDEIYSVVCPDGLIRVYHNDKVVAVFNYLEDAKIYIKSLVDTVMEW